MKNLFSLKLALIIFSISLISCGVDPLTGEECPDKSKTAFASSKRIGSKNTYISIYYNRTKNEQKILELNGIIPIQFEWVNNNELNIRISNNSNIISKNQSFKDVKINILKE